MLRYLDSIYPLLTAVSNIKELGIRQVGVMRWAGQVDWEDQRICLIAVGMCSASYYGAPCLFL